MKDIRIICNVLEIKKIKYPDFQAMTAQRDICVCVNET